MWRLGASTSGSSNCTSSRTACLSGSHKYGVASYDSLQVIFAPARFIEGEVVPQDAEVVDHTWQYVNKDGSPDRRFAANRQLPVVLYGSLAFNSQTGMNVLLHVSSKQLAYQFAEAFKARVQQANLPNVIISRLRSAFPSTGFAVYPDQQGVIHVKWDAPPQTEAVRSLFASAYSSRRDSQC